MKYSEVSNGCKRNQPQVGKMTKFEPQIDNIKMDLIGLTTDGQSVINLFFIF